jgi:protein-S-isoprenylcysteine O-methyltransferase Ste14
MHFGSIDKTDFLIPPVALFYFYTVFAAAFGWPRVGGERLFQSEAVPWIGVRRYLACHRQVLREEEFMRRQYGEEYSAYCRRVRRYV